ncbi:MAG: zf-HC2 domain-containing protein [Acidobacteriota bacterium]
MLLVTCKDFLRELNEYLDDLVDPATKAHWQAHVDECPNCFVIVDTTKKTMQIYKGMDQQELPPDIKSRLWQALEKKMADRRPPPPPQT